MPPQQHPFWDFMQSLNNPDPNNRRDPGHGVDHNTSPPSPFPGFPGFPFGAPPPPHGGHPPHQPHQPHRPHPPPPPPPGAGPGPWWDQAPPAWAYWFNNNFNGPPRYDEHPFSQNAGVNASREGEASREKNNEASSSPETMQEGEPFPDPAEVTPSESDDDEDNNHRRDGVPPPPSYPAEGGRRGRGRGGHAHAHGRGGRCGGRRGWRRGGPFEAPGAGGPPFDFSGMMRGFMGHPFFRNIRDQAAQYAQPAATRNTTTNTEDENTFSPPIDIFNTPDAFILHTALPGAKKDDVGVTWNPQTRSLRIAGVVHRPGDEAFLQTLTGVRERRVGVFEREVKLPPEGETEKKADGEEADLDVDVDGFGITAKMEEGILIVTVPKVEKEWMEVRKVDIA